MKRIFSFSLALAFAAALHAQTAADKKNLGRLCGCFDVDFKYAETFSPDSAYKFHPREHLGGLELALPIETTDRHVVIQHLLIIDDSTIVKHWREDWTYESPDLYLYSPDKTWTRHALPASSVKGAWTQTVWEVDDEPRYQGASRWIENGNRTYWESNTDAPLPRREYTTRSDYNVLRRNNRLVVTDSGYMHEQDNDKVRLSNGAEKLVAQEKGYNSYRRVPDTQCAAGKAWWERNKAFWTIVRDEWGRYLSTKSQLTIRPKIDNKRLDQQLYALFDSWSEKKLTDAEVAPRVRAALTQYL